MNPKIFEFSTLAIKANNAEEAAKLEDYLKSHKFVWYGSSQFCSDNTSWLHIHPKDLPHHMHWLHNMCAEQEDAMDVSTFFARFGDESMRKITTNLCITTTSIEDRKNVMKRLFELGFSRYMVNPDNNADKEEKMWGWARFPIVCATLHVNPSNSYHKQIQIFPNLESRYESIKNAPPISSTDFFSTYGQSSTHVSTMSPAPSTCSAKSGNETKLPDNPPNFIVDTGGNETLGKMVQELCFKAGICWSAFGKVASFNKEYPYLLVCRALWPGIRDRLGLDPLPVLYYSVGDFGSSETVLSAATQMGEIVRLLSTPFVPPKPPAPVGPTIHGYTGTYKSGDFTVKFGCAEISMTLVNDIVDLYKRVWKGNRKLASITLDSGKTLTIAQLQSIQDYVRAVEEYKG